MRRLEPASRDHCPGPSAWQGLIDAGRQSAVVTGVISRLFDLLRRSVDWRSTGTAPAAEGRLAAVALDVHLQDRGVVHEAVDGCERHCLVGEDAAPLAERLVGRDQKR